MHIIKIQKLGLTYSKLGLTYSPINLRFVILEWKLKKNKAKVLNNFTKKKKSTDIRASLSVHMVRSSKRKKIN